MAKIHLTKEEANKMMKLSGHVKGSTFKPDVKYVLERKGKEGLKAVEDRMSELGYPLKFEEISSFKWYPLSLACFVDLVMFEVFNWDDSTSFDMGYQSSAYSIAVKLVLKYFVSPGRAFKRAPIIWRQNIDIGKVEIVESREKEKKVILRIKNFKKIHPFLCEYHRGAFTKLAEMVINGKNIKANHTKCLFKDDDYEEYTVTWE